MQQIDDTTRALLTHLHRGGSFGYWWFVDAEKTYKNARGEEVPVKRTEWWKANMPTALRYRRSEHVYFGVHPVGAIPSERLNRKTGETYSVKPERVRAIIADIAAINCLFGEFDHAPLEVIERIDPQPSVIIESSPGKYHAYWLLNEPIALIDEDTRKYAQQLQAGWVTYVGSDDDAKDIARVLRVPGCRNIKAKYAPEYPMVTIRQAVLDRVYTADELAAVCRHLMPERIGAKSNTNSAAANMPSDADVVGMLDRLARSRADNYNEWLAVGCCLRPLGLHGLVLWDDWSQQSDKYQPGACEDKWYTLPEDSEGMGKLAYWARQDTPDNSAARTLDKMIARANGTTNGHTHTNGVTVAQPYAAPYAPPPPVVEPWGAIVPFDNYDVPTFPTHVFPSWLRAYVEAVAEATQTPADLAGMLALSVLALCGQRWIFVEATPGWIEPTNLFTATTQPPASRKSAVFRRMVAVIDQYEQTHGDEARIAHATAEAQRDVLEQRLEAAKKDAARATSSNDQYLAAEEVQRLAEELERFVLPAVPRYVVSDVTAETLASLMFAHDGRMAALSPEGDIFALMAGRYSSNGGPNFNIYLNAHAGDDIRIDRRNRTEYIHYPTLTIGITTQPDVIRGLADKAGFRGLGLLARFLYSMPASLVGHRKIDPEPVPSDVQAAYEQTITRILDGRVAYSANSANSANKSVISNLANISLFSLSPEASSTFRGFRTWIEPLLGTGAALGDFADWAGKLAGATARIAALLQMAFDFTDTSFPYSHNSQNSQNEISDAAMAAAIDLANYLTAHARAAFALMGADPAVTDARRALQWLEAKDVRIFTKRDLFEGIKGTIKKADDLDPILKVLTDHSYIRPVEMPFREGKGRKPSQQYEVNPGLHSHNSHNSQITIGLPTYTPPSVEYTVECVSTGAVDEWRVWNDALNQVVATYNTEGEAMDDAQRRAKRLPLPPRSNYRALGGY